MESCKPIENGRNFRLVRDDELPNVLEFLAGHLPDSLKFHQTVLTYMKHRVWDFYFYVATDWPEVPICLHFPGMTLSPHDLVYESFGVYCPSENIHQLELIRNEDILIDWSKPLYINFLNSIIADELFRLYNGTGTVERMLVADTWMYDTKQTNDNDNDDDDDDEQVKNLASNIEILTLTEEHVDTIYDLYPAKNVECKELFVRLIKSLPAVGVFVDGELAAWMIQSYYGAMISMQTKPQHRRKGYGTILVRYLTKTVAERGYIPFVMIKLANDASRSLYTKLGFVQLYQSVRAALIPNGLSKDEASDEFQQDVENTIRQLKILNTLQDAISVEDDQDDDGGGGGGGDEENKDFDCNNLTNQSSPNNNISNHQLNDN